MNKESKVSAEDIALLTADNMLEIKVDFGLVPSGMRQDFARLIKEADTFRRNHPHSIEKIWWQKPSGFGQVVVGYRCTGGCGAAWPRFPDTDRCEVCNGRTKRGDEYRSGMDRVTPYTCLDCGKVREST